MFYRSTTLHVVLGNQEKEDFLHKGFIFKWLPALKFPIGWLMIWQQHLHQYPRFNVSSLVCGSRKSFFCEVLRRKNSPLDVLSFMHSKIIDMTKSRFYFFTK